MEIQKPSQYRRWLREQIVALENQGSHPICDEQHFEDVRTTVKQAGHLAAIIGIPSAVAACQMRAGGTTVFQAKAILAECLAAVPGIKRPERVHLSPPEVAKRYGVSPDTVRGWIASGLLRATNIGKGKKKPRFRIEPQALEEFDRKRTAGFKTPTIERRPRSSMGLSVTKFSDRRGTTRA